MAGRALRLVAFGGVTLLVTAILGAAAVIAIGKHSRPPAPTTAQVVKMVQPSVVAVIVTPFRSDPREGSGFVYGTTGRILTSAHLLARALSVSVMDWTGESYSASVIGVDRNAGVAELAVNGMKAKPLKAATGAPKVGTRVLVIDNPDGFLTHDATQGAISGTGEDLNVGDVSYTNMVRTSAVATEGDTGGPLVNASGELVGMIAEDDTGHALAIPVVSFAADAKTWAASATPLDLGPPMVTATAHSLMLTEIGGGWSLISDAKSPTSSSWHKLWEKQPAHGYGGESMDLYIWVATTPYDAADAYRSQVDYSKGKGFVAVGPVAGIGDQATAMQLSNSSEIAFLVTWSDRNVKVDVFLAGARPVPPEVTMEKTLALALAESALVSADLANYQ